MEKSTVLWLLGMQILSISLAVFSVVVSWRAASRSTVLRKWLRERVLTQTSDAKVASIRGEMAELFSTLGKLTTTVHRLSSRHSMQDKRAAQSMADEPPPVGTSKTELRKFYGVSGLTGPEQARRQLSMVPNNTERK